MNEDELVRKIFEKSLEDPTLDLHKLNLPRKVVLRVAQQYKKDLDDARIEFDHVTKEMEKYRYTPLWGAGRSPGTSLEAKHTFVARLTALFPDLTEYAERGEVYSVANHIQLLLSEVSNQLPDNSLLDETDLPSPSGIIFGVSKFFECTDAIAWIAHGPEDSDQSSWNYGGVQLIEYGDRGLQKTPWNFVFWKSEEALIDLTDKDFLDNIDTVEHAIQLRRFFGAFCYFLSQRLLVSKAEKADRASRRRVHDDRLIQVIELRATESNPSEALGNTIEHDFRWMVRGHWRKQPYGPKRGLVKPIWISPYVKGPDDKPVKINTRLFEVAR